ncbi:MAG TPA: peptidoglycan recognition family protein, partial [Pseudoxanthomonas sp.]|nr:peptidoglycan recognition family protein [Pseudoxanthomonas sp.]
MPTPFKRLSVAEFAQLLDRFPFSRRITSVHMHHTWRPNHAQFRGHDSIVAMWRFHTQERGFSDIAQHLTIDPEGFVWTGRNWNAAPASASGYNGNANSGPFMFETVGDFDRGMDPLAGAQREAVLDVIKLVQKRFKLEAESLMFHNQMAPKSCPGTGIDRNEMIAAVSRHEPSTAREAASGPFGPAALASSESVEQAIALL